MNISMFTLSKEETQRIKNLQKKHIKNCRNLEKFKNWRKANKVEGFCFGTDDEYEEEGIVLFYSKYYVNKGEEVIVATIEEKISESNFEKFLIQFVRVNVKSHLIVFQSKAYDTITKWIEEKKQDWFKLEFIEL